jgi:hypothetical protein
LYLLHLRLDLLFDTLYIYSAPLEHPLEKLAALLLQLFGFPVFRNAWFSRRVIDILAKPIMETGIIESYSHLTDRESEVVCLMAKGYAINKIAEALAIAKGTVKNHLVNISETRSKFACRSGCLGLAACRNSIERKHFVENSPPGNQSPEGDLFELHHIPVQPRLFPGS